MGRKIRNSNSHDNFVYSLKDPNSDIPFYIGVSKGNKNRRFKEHLREAKLPLKKQTNERKCKKINEIINNKSTPEYKILKSNLNRTEAYSLERENIKKYGRINFDKNGVLTNIHPGNDSYKEKNSIYIHHNTPSNSGRGGLSNACSGWDDWIERRKAADEKWRQKESAKRKESDIKNNNITTITTNLPYDGIPLEKLIENERINQQNVNTSRANVQNDTSWGFQAGCGCFLIIVCFIILSIIVESCRSTQSAQQEYKSHKIEMITPPITKPIPIESLKIEKPEENIVETPKPQPPIIIKSTPIINTTNNIQSSREIYEPIYKKIEEKPKKSQTQINIEKWEKRKKQIDSIYRRD